LSLAAYRRDAHVVGIDVSREMLDKARWRARKLHLPQVEGLLEMDAEEIKFPDRSFDAVVALYVMTVVPDASRVAAEMRRVCVPTGKIVVVGHFASDRPLLYKIEKIFACLLRQIGLTSLIRLPQLIDAIGLSPPEVRLADLFGFWKVVSFRNDGT